MQRFIVTLAILLGVGSTACGKEAPAAPSVVTGVITKVAAAGSEVTSFDLDADGESYRIQIDPGRDYGFDLTHLNEHQSTGDPVRVRLRERDEALYALRIDDA
jgi:hypothetical protein